MLDLSSGEMNGKRLHTAACSLYTSHGMVTVMSTPSCLSQPQTSSRRASWPTLPLHCALYI